MKFVSHIKRILIVALCLGSIQASAMRRVVRNGIRTVPSAFRALRANFNPNSTHTTAKLQGAIVVPNIRSKAKVAPQSFSVHQPVVASTKPKKLVSDANYANLVIPASGLSEQIKMAHDMAQTVTPPSQVQEPLRSGSGLFDIKQAFEQMSNQKQQESVQNEAIDSKTALSDLITEVPQLTTHKNNAVIMRDAAHSIVQTACQAQSIGYVPFVIEERLLPEALRLDATRQVLNGSVESACQLLTPALPAIANIQNNAIVPQTNSVVPHASAVTVSTAQNPVVVLGAQRKLGAMNYRVGCMNASLAQKLFGFLPAGLQWIGTFNNPVHAALKQTIAQMQNSPHVKSNKSPIGDKAKMAAAAIEAPSFGQHDHDGGERTQKNNEVPRVDETADTRGAQQHQDHNRYERVNADQAFTNDHSSDSAKDLLSNKLGGSTAATTIAQIDDVTKKKTVSQDPADDTKKKVNADKGTVVDTGVKKAEKVKKKKHVRFMTPCQEAVMKYGKNIITALQQGSPMQPEWAGSSKYIAEMVATYNNQLARVQEFKDQPEAMKQLVFIAQTIFEFVGVTQAIIKG